MPGREGPLIAACNFNMYLCLPIDLVLITCSIKIIALTIEMLSIEKVKCFFFRVLKFLMYRKGQLMQTVKCYTVFCEFEGVLNYFRWSLHNFIFKQKTCLAV